MSPEDAIKPWGPFLASHGIDALTVGTHSGADSPEIRSTALNTLAGAPAIHREASFSAAERDPASVDQQRA